MDPQIAWVRARLVREVLLRVSVLTVLCSLSGGLVLRMGVGAGPAASVVGAVSIGVLCGAGWLLVALFTNPLDLRYLRSYLSESVEVVDQLELTTGAGLATRGDGSAELCYTLLDDTAQRPLYDVFRAGPMVIGRSRTSEAVVFYSCLADGRGICTDRQTSLPSTGWIVNTVRSENPEVRMRAHLRLIDHLSRDGVAVVPSPDPRIVLRHLEDEREAYRQLGPVLSCYLDLDGERTPLRLTVDLDPVRVLDLSGIPASLSMSGFVRRLRVAPASIH